MALPQIVGEFGIVADPVFSISDKGNGVLRLRGVAKDRTRDSNGTWSDGDPCFLDITLFGKQAEHTFESVAKGDSVVVSGRLKMSEWTDKEGTKRTSYGITADLVGPSTRWKPTKESTFDKADVMDRLGASEAPF